MGKRRLAAGAVLCGALWMQLPLSAMSAQAVKGSGHMAGQHAAAGSQADPAKAFDAMLTSYEREMTGVAGAMPAEKYNFAPSAAIFVPGQGANFATVSTFAEQVKHAAETNYEIYGAMCDLKPGVDMKALGALKSKDDIVAALAASFVYAHRAVGTLTTQNAFEVVGAHGQTRATMAALAMVHGNDHYGQLAEYLRMNGIIPPASRK